MSHCIQALGDTPPGSKAQQHPSPPAKVPDPPQAKVLGPPQTKGHLAQALQHPPPQVGSALSTLLMAFKSLCFDLEAGEARSVFIASWSLGQAMLQSPTALRT